MRRERGPSRELIEDDAAEPLPAGTYATALDIHFGMQRTRIERLYNRTRAVFAESIVAALLPGAVLIEDPAAAWDVSWQPSRRARPIRIQVKCSGERLPRRPGRRTRAIWDFDPPKRGYDPETNPLSRPGTTATCSCWRAIEVRTSRTAGASSSCDPTASSSRGG